MNEVTLVKVTLNEATDPDLYAYIMRYENPRLRAGAFRALARAALLNDRGEVLASVSEASGSFGGFINALPKWLSGCKPPTEWWDRVAIPAFQRNETELYRRCRPVIAL